MSESGKSRGRLDSDATHLVMNLQDLEKALRYEEGITNDLVEASKDLNPNNVTLTMRNGAASSLRFTTVFFDLPDNVFFLAVNLLDRILTKMKVKKEHLACLSTSCLYLSIMIHDKDISAKYLLLVTHCKFRIQDLQRMNEIVERKLEIDTSKCPLTILVYLNIFLRIFECLAEAGMEINRICSTPVQKKLLVKRLQIVMTDSVCASYRPCVLALTVIHTSTEWYQYMSNNIPPTSRDSILVLQLFKIISQLQHFCSMSFDEYLACYMRVLHVLEVQNCDKLEKRPANRAVNPRTSPKKFISKLAPVIEGH